ncbi:MAG: hypothetical protein ACD_75C02162G0003 [uncultured bacterium]|nr:MAG: hypothetical protein ACD_75C02162G0003 [uncultured bacterium]
MKEILITLYRKMELAKLFSKDWLLKFVSLVLAVILWYFVGGEDRVDKNVMIPIEIINLPRDLVISNQFKKEIEVTVSGPRSLILEMSNRALTRQVDLSAATPGTMVIENDHKHIPVLRGITIQRVQPSSIILSLDKLIQKQFPVEAKTVGRVADGYYVRFLKIDPDVITITGPQTTLSQVDELSTKAINLEGVKHSSQLQVPLELEPAIVELIGETSVTADITIGVETVTRSIDGVEVHAVLDGVKREVNPEAVKVIANIPKVLMDQKIDPKTLITLTALKQGDDEILKVKAVVRTDLEMPIEVLSIVPDTVRLVGNSGGPAVPAQLGSGKNGYDFKTIAHATGEDRQTKVEGGSGSGGPAANDAASVKVLKNTKTKKKY